MKNISIFTIFYKSLYSFKEIAKFRYLSIGKIIQYVFILVLIYFLPSFVQTLVVDKNPASIFPGFDAGSIAIMIPIFFIFMYVLNIGILFLKISILAGIALVLAKLLNRKLPYRQSWRLSALCITLPTLLFGILPLFRVDIPYGSVWDALLSLLIIFFSIRKIPKQKK